MTKLYRLLGILYSIRHRMDIVAIRMGRMKQVKQYVAQTASNS